MTLAVGPSTRLTGDAELRGLVIRKIHTSQILGMSVTAADKTRLLPGKIMRNLKHDWGLTALTRLTADAESRGLDS